MWLLWLPGICWLHPWTFQDLDTVIFHIVSYHTVLPYTDPCLFSSTFGGTLTFTKASSIDLLLCSLCNLCCAELHYIWFFINPLRKPLLFTSCQISAVVFSLNLPVFVLMVYLIPACHIWLLHVNITVDLIEFDSYVYT